MVIADCFQYFETKTDNKNQKISPQERNTSNRKDVAIVVQGFSPSFFFPLLHDDRRDNNISIVCCEAPCCMFDESLTYVCFSFFFSRRRGRPPPARKHTEQAFACPLASVRRNTTQTVN